MELDQFSDIIGDIKLVRYLFCHFCNKKVSSEFEPINPPFPDKGIVVRALIICPECIEKEVLFKKDLEKVMIHAFK